MFVTDCGLILNRICGFGLCINRPMHDYTLYFQISTTKLLNLCRPIEFSGRHFPSASSLQRVRFRGPTVQEVVRSRPLLRRSSAPVQPAGAPERGRNRGALHHAAGRPGARPGHPGLRARHLPLRTASPAEEAQRVLLAEPQSHVL